MHQCRAFRIENSFRALPFVLPQQPTNLRDNGYRDMGVSSGGTMIIPWATLALSGWRDPPLGDGGAGTRLRTIRSFARTSH